MTDKDQKFHYAGVDPNDGKTIFVECRAPKGDDDIVTVVKGVPAEAGKPGPIGTKLAYIHQDGDHIRFEDAEASAAEQGHSGPALVATKAFREGWEQTFGKNGVN